MTINSNQLVNNVMFIVNLGVFLLWMQYSVVKMPTRTLITFTSIVTTPSKVKFTISMLSYTKVYFTGTTSVGRRTLGFSTLISV